MAGDMVFVGCKMPMGVVLNLRKTNVERTNGLVSVTVDGEDLGEVTLRGNKVAVGKAPIDIDGYVFTPVPKDFWDEWIKRNGSSSLVKDGFIKVAMTEGQKRGIAREMAEQPGMYEPIVPGKDPKDAFRSPNERAARGAGLGVKTYEHQDAAA